MFTQNFDQFVDRAGTNSYKWEHAGKDVIPLWVADMDFTTAPCIIEAIKRRAEHGIYGYVNVPEAFYDAFIHWFDTRHGFKMEREWLQYTTGVVPAISAIIKALTLPGDQVVVLTPVYNCFFSSIRNNGCETVQVPLARDAASGRYSIDYDALERALAGERARLMVFCNPHNPAGRVWTPDELRRVGELALKYGVTVISDEIHNELVMPGYSYTPMATVSDDIRHNTITCISPSKSWNIAGLKIACIACDNPQWRERIDRVININEICDVNPFGVEAAIAAYSPEGEEWMQQLCRYLRGNYQMLSDFFKANFPQFTVTPLEGTYLAWINIESSGMSADALTQFLVDEARVMVNSGTMYGAAGEGFIRINMALPRVRLEEALRRIAAALKK